jgi:hypothetical protein
MVSEWVKKRTLRDSSEVVMWTRHVLWEKVANWKSSKVRLTCNFLITTHFVSSVGFLYFVVMSCIKVWVGHNVIMTEIRHLPTRPLFWLLLLWQEVLKWQLPIVALGWMCLLDNGNGTSGTILSGRIGCQTNKPDIDKDYDLLSLAVLCLSSICTCFWSNLIVVGSV